MMESIPKKSNVLLAALLTCLAGIATLIYLELGVRFLAPAAFPLLRTDPVVGSIHVKNFNGMAWSANAERYSHIRTNNLGYNGNFVAPQKAPDTIRIAIMGDSVTAGLEVDTDQSYPVLLENRLNIESVCRENKFEVMNFGVGASGTFLEYQTFKHAVSPLAPDYTLVVFSNDYADNLNKSHFSLENYAEERSAVGIKAFLLQFTLPKFVFNKVQRNPTVRQVLAVTGLLEISVDEVITATSTESAISDRYYSYTFELIEKLKKLVENSGSAFILVPYPSMANFEGDPTWAADPSNGPLIAFAESTRIDVLNPIPRIAEERLKRGDCLVANCADHLNEAGHEAMADILFDFFSERLPADMPRDCTET